MKIYTITKLITHLEKTTCKARTPWGAEISTRSTKSNADSNYGYWDLYCILHLFFSTHLMKKLSISRV